MILFLFFLFRSELVLSVFEKDIEGGHRSECHAVRWINNFSFSEGRVLNLRFPNLDLISRDSLLRSAIWQWEPHSRDVRRELWQQPF